MVELPRKRHMAEVKCARPHCNNIIIVMAVTGKTLCPDCFGEQMNIYRRGEKPVIDSPARARRAPP